MIGIEFMLEGFFFWLRRHMFNMLKEAVTPLIRFNAAVSYTYMFPEEELHRTVCWSTVC